MQKLPFYLRRLQANGSRIARRGVRRWVIGLVREQTDCNARPQAIAISSTEHRAACRPIRMREGLVAKVARVFANSRARSTRSTNGRSQRTEDFRRFGPPPSRHKTRLAAVRTSCVRIAKG